MPGSGRNDDAPPGKGAGRLGLPPNVLAFGFVSFLNDLASEMIYPLLPRFLTQTLGASPTAIGAIEGAAESVASLLKLGSGWLSDRMPRRKPLVILGYSIAGLVRPLVAIASRPVHVMAVRVGDRVGKGLRTSPRDAMLADATDADIRGRAYGFHRGADHAGAVMGPLVAAVLMGWFGLEMTTVFWLSLVPSALAVGLLAVWVREKARKRAAPRARQAATLAGAKGLGRGLWTYYGVLFLFTMTNFSTDMFVLMRARDLGIGDALLPVVWSALHVVKALSTFAGGTLSDRVGRKPLLLAGWTWFALVYAGFALATEPWHAVALFLVYGLFFGMTEGTEKALVADLAPERLRGTAFGWYNLTLGVGALPAAVLFGMAWEDLGPGGAFALGSGLAVASALLLFVLVRPPKTRSA